MKQDFIKFLEALMEAAPEVVSEYMNDNIQTYIDIIKDDTKTDKPILTDNGKVILDYLQKNPTPKKARDIANDLAISSRTVSGGMRKLVSDGFCEKVSQDPVIYSITEKGKNFKID